jgi:hypothetical protein
MSLKFVPVEYGVMNNGREIRMVLQSDYAELKSEYFRLLHILQLNNIDPDQWEDD